MKCHEARSGTICWVVLSQLLSLQKYVSLVRSLSSSALKNSHSPEPVECSVTSHTCFVVSIRFMTCLHSSMACFPAGCLASCICAPIDQRLVTFFEGCPYFYSIYYQLLRVFSLLKNRVAYCSETLSTTNYWEDLQRWCPFGFCLPLGMPLQQFL